MDALKTASQWARDGEAALALQENKHPRSDGPSGELVDHDSSEITRKQSALVQPSVSGIVSPKAAMIWSTSPAAAALERLFAATLLSACVASLEASDFIGSMPSCTGAPDIGFVSLDGQGCYSVRWMTCPTCTTTCIFDCGTGVCARRIWIATAARKAQER